MSITKSTVTVTTIIAAAALVIGGIGGYLFSGGSSTYDVSLAGQTSYACDLAQQITRSHQDEGDWGEVDEDPAFNEVPAVAALLGGMTPHVKGESELIRLGRGLHEAFVRFDSDQVHTSLDQIIDACENR